MKYIILFFLFINFSFSQYFKGKIEFNDGKTIEGFLKTTKRDDVKFKETENSKIIEYDKNLIKNFEFLQNDKLRKFIYSQTQQINGDQNRTDKWNRLLEIISEGKIVLYRYETSFNNTSTISYFLKKSINNLPIFYYGEGFMYKQKFIPFVEKYFIDCPILVDLVKSKKIKHNKYIDVVEYYNNKCE